MSRNRLHFALLVLAGVSGIGLSIALASSPTRQSRGQVSNGLALHPAGSHPFSSPRKNRLPDDSRFFVVDDQGFEVAYMSLKPSKERRLSDIIFVQYSKNTQKYSFLALAGELRKVPFRIQIAREALTTLWMIR